MREKKVVKSVVAAAMYHTCREAIEKGEIKYDGG